MAIKLSEVADVLEKHGGCTIETGIPGMGRIYMGSALVDKFKEVFGREPTPEEYWLDWYDCDFERLAPRQTSESK